MRISDWSSDVCSSDLVVSRADEADVDHAGFDGYGNPAKIDEQVREDVVVLLGGRFDCQLELVGVGLRHVHVHAAQDALGDRQSVVKGTSVSARVDLGGRRIIKTHTHSDVICNAMLYTQQ